MLEERLKASFRNFLTLVWRHLGFPKPTRLQLDIALFLQHGGGDGVDKVMVEAFRGVGKTWVTASFIVWLLYCNPDLKILVVSASKNHADKTSAFCLQLIRSIPALHHLAPSGNQADSKVMFTVGPAADSRDPSVTSMGITGMLTGSRADLILSDDVETSQNSQTQAMREKLKTSTEEYAAILKPGGRIIYLGTPQCEDSIYRALPAKGYTIRIWPARYPDQRLQEAYNGCLSPLLVADLAKNPQLVGQPTEPERFTEEVLASREAEYARSGFALQFMLDTTLSDSSRYPLKLSDLIVMDLNADVAPPKVVWGRAPELIINDLPNVGMSGDRLYRPMAILGEQREWAPYTGSVLAIDPSGRGRDETGYAVVKILHGLLYAVEWGGLIGGYEDETLRQLAIIAKRQKVNEVIIESNFGDGMFTKLFTPVLSKYHLCSIEEVRHSTQKEKRIIDTLEPVLNAHRLIMDRRLVEQDYKTVSQYSAETSHQYMGLHQLTRITRDRGALKRDDRLDALAIAVAYWVEHMSRDTDQAVSDHQAELLDREVEKFLEHCLPDAPRSEQTWISPN